MAEVDITLHNRQVHSVFELLGAKENDLTYSLGWALHKSELLSHVLCQRALARPDIEAPTAVHLQEHQESGVSQTSNCLDPAIELFWKQKGDSSRRAWLSFRNISHAFGTMSPTAHS